MIFLLALAVGTAIAAAASRLRRSFTPRGSARLGMAVAMGFAGVSHLVLATPFIQHLPAWVPLRPEIVFFSGLVEIALGIALLLPPPTRRRVGILLALYFVTVFPGNLYVAVYDVDVDGQPGGFYPWVRLPLQLLFIAWAVWSTREAPVSPVVGEAAPTRLTVEPPVTGAGLGPVG
jgi:uncharacterized membrane protein